MNTPLRAVIYTRVSLDRSGEGASNDRQEEACRALASMRGWQVVDIFQDISLSAYKDVERPGWARTQAAMRSGSCDVVIAWKMDRITRTVAGLTDLIMLSRETGVSLATTDGMLDLTTPTGKAVATILATVAEMEVELKGERQALANKQRREAGEPWPSGFRLFGYTLRGEVIPEEAALIQTGAADFLSGKTLAAVARDWDESGVKPTRADTWRNTTVRTLLQNPRLAGFQTHGREIVPGVRGNWEPILAEDTFALVNLRLNQPNRGVRTGAKGPNPSHLLSGLAVCGKCGEHVRGQGKDGRGNPCYRCPNSCVMAAREAVDNRVRAAFTQTVTMMLPGLLLTIDSRQAKTGDTEGTLAAIQAHRAELEELGKRWADQPQQRLFIDAATIRVQEKIADLEAGLVEAMEPYDPKQLTADALQRFRDLSTDDQRAVLSRVARVTLHPKGRGRKNVPLAEQVSMDVQVTYPSGRRRWVPALARETDVGHDKGASDHAAAVTFSPLDPSKGPLRGRSFRDLFPLAAEAAARAEESVQPSEQPLGAAERPEGGSLA